MIKNGKAVTRKQTYRNFALIAASMFVAQFTLMLLFSPLVSPPSPVSSMNVSRLDAVALI